MEENSQLNIFRPTFLEGGGEMGQLMRSINWEATPLGHPHQWPVALKQTVSMMFTTPYPIMVSWGREYTQLYNDGYRHLLGTTKHPGAMGAGTRETFPEVWDTIGPMFDGVMDGEPVIFSDFKLMLERNGYPEECYFDFSYSPIKDELGHIGGVLVICRETTEKVMTLKKLEITRHELESSQAEITRQRDWLNRFFMKAPAGICVLGGPGMVYEFINETYQQLLPARTFLNRQVYEALPELIGTPIQQFMQQVYDTGEPFDASEVLIPIAVYEGGPTRERYFNINYQARFDKTGKIDGIVIFVIEVTDMVLTVKELADTKNNLELAITAADLGTFDGDLENKTVFCDKRSRALFGISGNDGTIHEDDFFNRVHPDDRERVEMLAANAFNKQLTGGNYDAEYRTIGEEDGQVRWIRAIGKVHFDDQDKPLRLAGTVMDITGHKLEEIRKNEFIEMVSQQLKIPFHSLSAIIQQLKDTDDTFIDELADNANVQLKKIGDMIEGF